MSQVYPVATLELALDDPPSAAYADMQLGLKPDVYYRLGEAAGTTGANSLVNAVTGTGSATPSGASFSFGNPGSLPYDSDTAAALTSAGTIGGLVAFVGVNDGGFKLRFKRIGLGAGDLVAATGSTSGAVRIGFDASNRIFTSTVIGPAVTDTTTWHDLTVMFTVADTTRKIYLDGVLVASGVAAWTLAGTISTGLYYGGGGVYVDEYASWAGREVSAGEIYALYLAAQTHTTPTYTAVSQFFMGGSQQRGGSHEFDAPSAGTATAKLSNTQRQFDPLNTAGPYYGKLKSMRRARLKWTINATTYTRFVGYERGWPQSRQGPNMATVDLSLVDGFEQLAQADIGKVTLLGGTPGAAIGYALDAAFWPRSLRNLDTGGIAVSPARLATPTEFLSALSYIQGVAAGDLGSFFISADGIATFHDRYHRARTVTSSGTFGDSASGEALTYTSIVVDTESVDNVINDVTSTIDGGTPQHWSDGQSISSYFTRSQQRQPLTDTDADALLQSKLIVTTHATPGLRVNEITIVPGDNLALWAQVLGREIGDRVTIKINPVGLGLPAGGAAISVDCFIEAMNDNYPAGQWSSTWQLSPVSASVQGWILDDPILSDLGTTTYLAS